MEPTTQNNGINAIKEVRKLFNERRSNLSRKEINEIRKKLRRKEAFFKEKRAKIQFNKYRKESAKEY